MNCCFEFMNRLTHLQKTPIRLPFFYLRTCAHRNEFIFCLFCPKNNHTMKYIYYSILGTLICASCSSENTESKADETNETVKTDSVKADTVTSQHEEFDHEISWENVYFSGWIEDLNHMKYEVMMRLSNKDGKVTGQYFYVNHKKPIDLILSLYGDEMVLDEFYKNKATGSWRGAYTGKEDENGWTGTWYGNDTEFTFELEPVAKEDYHTELQKSKSTKKLEAFSQLLTQFKKEELPFEIKTAPDGDGEGFDKTTMETHFDEGDLFVDIGYSEFTPGHYYETDFGYALVLFYYYSPGAFGITSNNVMLYTFDKKGQLLDKDMIGCYCMDTNIGPRDYYSTDEHFTFKSGEISKESTHEHATLFPDQLEEGEEAFSEVEVTNASYTIDASGIITKAE